MTTLQLFLWIVTGLLLQVALFLGIGFLRQWLNFISLQRTAEKLTNPVPSHMGNEEAFEPLVAWKGLRAFRVERKVLEDADEKVCSFYLVPEDG